MKMLKIAAISSVLILSSACSFAGSNELSEEHSKHHPATTEKQSSKEIPTAGSNMPMMADMQEHMKKMQDTMQKMHAATSDAERKKLMEEHMKLMADHMKMMKGMGMGDKGSMPAMNNKDAKQDMGMMDGGMKCGMMDRMDMMQQMMDQMMQHMAAME